MSQTTKQGFTLLELIVAIGIFGALSLVSVQMLWDTLTSRSKQYSIETSTAAIRPILSTISRAIQSATAVTISGSELQISGSPCLTFAKIGTAIVQATGLGASCPPDINSGVSVTPPTVSVTAFSVIASGPPSVYTVTIGALYKDSLGMHTLYATTSSVRRSL